MANNLPWLRTPILLVLTWNASTMTFESPKIVETAAPVLNMTVDKDGNIWTVLDHDTRVSLYVRKDDSVMLIYIAVRQTFAFF